MATEIERRFLVLPHRWTAPSGGDHLVQGYLSVEPERTVRVRVTDSEARLTIKGLRRGAVGLEFEYPIPVADATVILRELCSDRIVVKTRHRIAVGSHVWDVDVFGGANEGLVLAEVELEEEGDGFDRPEWLGDEVTGDHRYTSLRLALRPYPEWGVSGAGGS